MIYFSQQFSTISLCNLKGFQCLLSFKGAWIRTSSRVYIFKLTPTCCNSCFDLVPGNVWLSHLINSTWNAVAINQHIFLICISYCITVRFIACKSWYFWKCLIFRTSPRSLRLEMYFKLALFEFCRTFFESLSSLLPFFFTEIWTVFRSSSLEIFCKKRFS